MAVVMGTADTLPQVLMIVVNERGLRESVSA